MSEETRALPSFPDEAARNNAIAAVGEFFDDSVYCCSRSYSAWEVGTMGLDDFDLASQDDEFLSSVVDIVIAALSGVPYKEAVWGKPSEAVPQ